MSKFFTEQIITEATESIAISEYNSQDEAERAFHKVFADNIGGENVEFVRCKVINASGGQIMNEYWQVPAPEPVEGEDPEPVVEIQKYYFTQIRFGVNGSIQRSMTAYDTEDEALVAYHNLLYSLMANEQIAAVTVLIEDRRGAELHRRYWERKA